MGTFTVLSYCADMPADNKLKRSACNDISGSCSSARQLELLILDLFIDKLAPDMPLKSFRRLCGSIDIAEYTFLPRKELVLRLQTRRHNLQNMISNSSPLGILHDFDHMRKPALMNVAVGHGLVVAPTKSRFSTNLIRQPNPDSFHNCPVAQPMRTKMPKPKKMMTCSQPSPRRKKSGWTPIKFETHVLDSYVV
jgi:hypothetical protein